MIRKWSALLILCGVFLADSAGASVLLDRVVAVVNQEVITWSELYRSMELDASPQVRELKESERAKVFRDHEAQFLESVINMKLQLQEAAAQGMAVSDDELKEGIDSVKKKYSMKDDEFKESLRKEGYTYAEYARRFREQILLSKIVNQQIRNKIVVSDRDVEAYLSEQTAREENVEGFRISQILFKKPKNADAMQVVEDRAAAVLQKIRAGGDFKELARQYSEDPSATAGGDIGLIKKTQLLREFTEALAKITPGQVSEPFWSERGLHIIRLEERVEPRDRKILEEEARKAVGERRFAERYTAWIKSLREKAFIEIRL